jgi:hypothetical protein
MVPSQKQLEQMYGKAEPGMYITPDGRMAPIAGGSAENRMKSGVESMGTAIQNIDEMIGARGPDGQLMPGAKPHAGFESAVGVSIPKALGAGFIPGTDTRDFMARLEQSQGGAFLQAFEALKGGGQITEVEGRKATAAITRMQTAQSEGEFVKAAMEFRGAVESGMQKLSGRVGAQQVAPAQVGGPKMGAVEDGFVFMGGDPKSPSSWKRVR